MHPKKALGTHLIVELYECDTKKLDDVSFVEKAMLDATEKSGATIISHNIHKFNPHGVSGVVIIAESHVSIHTWPEYGYAAVDVFTCGDCINPWAVEEVLEQRLNAGNTSSMEMKRGLFKRRTSETLPHKPQIEKGR